MSLNNHNNGKNELEEWTIRERRKCQEQEPQLWIKQFASVHLYYSRMANGLANMERNAQPNIPGNNIGHKRLQIWVIQRE
jgi:hypothetical protein